MCTWPDRMGPSCSVCTEAATLGKFRRYGYNDHGDNAA